MRSIVTLACTECKRRNYSTTKNKRNTPDKLEFKKFCRFCQRNVKFIDHKNVEILRRYVPDRGKISPRRITGTCAFHQRKLVTAIKRARLLALLPFVAD